MGCFNVAGSVSNISIGNHDPAVFFPLVPFNFDTWKEPQVKVGPKTRLVGDGTDVCFVPRFLPIIGEYCDNGSLQNIVRDKNVEYIEAYFGISIDDFMTVLTKHRSKITCPDDEKDEELRKLSGMFEHLTVYQEMVAYGQAHETDLLKNGCMQGAVLELMGFKQQDGKTGHDSYPLYYRHPALDGYALISNDSSSRLKCLTTGIHQQCFHHPVELIEWCETQGITLCDTDVLKNTCRHHLNVEEVVSKLSQTKDESRLDPEERAELDALPPEKRQEALEHILRLEFGWERDRMYNRIYQLRQWKGLRYAVEDPGYEAALVALLNFDGMMYSANKFYFPAMSGDQHGNWHVSQHLYQTCLQVLVEQRRKWDEDN